MDDDFFIGDPFDPLPCKRCEGTGRVRYRYGVPGQDRHLPASKIVWQDEGVEQQCPVCKGTGKGKLPEPQRPPMRVDFDEYGAPHRTILNKEDHSDKQDHEGGALPH